MLKSVKKNIIKNVENLCLVLFLRCASVGRVLMISAGNSGKTETFDLLIAANFDKDDLSVFFPWL